MKRTVFLGLFLVLLAASPALAGIGKGNGEIGFDGGWTWFDSSVTDQTGGHGVFRGGYHVTDLFQIEGQENCSVATDTSLGFDVDITLCATLVDGVFNFHSQSGNVVPYVLVGVGSAKLESDAGILGTSSDTGSASVLAAGSRFFFGRHKRAAFRIELSSLTEKTFDETSSHTSLDWGFTWRLGAGK
ncbi:MAG TPA: outer membrane beta-barrel protein [Candidatus Polarisedimenticolia bacterium]|nr:outer membrane beta-barrel protein [Candidatus Polarisedimenticolia bacterium]